MGRLLLPTLETLHCLP